MTLEKLRDILKKELNFKGDHVPYSLYSKELTIRKCKNIYLKEEFKDWEDTPGFLTALYNLCIRLSKETTIEELKAHLKNIERKYAFNVNYFVSGDKYCCKKIQGDSVWRECLVMLDKATGNEDSNDYVSISKLKDYLADNPNLHCCSGMCWNIDEKTLKELIKSGLVYKPSQDEDFLN